VEAPARIRGTPGAGRRLKSDGQPIRILRLITRLNAGGPARHVIWLSEGLRRFGYETLLLAGRPAPGEDDLSAFGREKGVNAVEIAGLSREIDPLRDLSALRRLAAKVREFDPHILHTHTSKAGVLGRWAARRINRSRRAGRAPIRTVHTFHGHVLSGYFPPARERVFRALERALGGRATDAAVVLSPQQREEIVVRYEVILPEKVFVIPLALDLSDFEALPPRGAFRRELSLSENDFVFGIVGRIAPIKNHELFLRAAAIVARRIPRARFVVVGGGSGLEELRRVAAALGISESVRFAGVRTDLPSVYCDLDAVVLTSHNEGTPLSLIEAMASGLPVVATDVGGVRDLLTTEWSGDVLSRRFFASEKPRGLLVGSGEAQGLAAAEIRLIEEPGLARDLGEAGRRYAFRYHGLPRLLTDVDQLYRLELTR
jgi:glycosyltransferase involved in cell wall biosynthesis